jgi:hypothetical protein
MRGYGWRTILAAAIAGTGLILAAGAQAHDDDWRWEHRRHGWHHEPERRVVEREVIVERPRPVYVAPAPVIVPAPVMVAPVAPAYSQPAEPSLNLNFNIPLR